MNILTKLFYRSNNRGETGVDWAKNVSLPQSTRDCETSIGVLRWVVEKCQETNDNLIADIFYKNERKGRYKINPQKMREWLLINKYYISSYGEALQIPLVLWECLIEYKKDGNE